MEAIQVVQIHVCSDILWSREVGLDKRGGINFYTTYIQENILINHFARIYFTCVEASSRWEVGGTMGIGVITLV